ncbi:uncharacterized protein LOC116749067 isoform X2 [Phocoena sinus]|uniref:uncharacterized protein LOC116749067 isoform X2 n=1 Tax=Phocoena sinus TaxID=42100 RepID=UPI0013C3E7CD|nr:uncharacterized protein LOC116749067 isoform X2 [Phocoena sinus]XP_032478914.1 uncharacterized protein LOC116749067 isoform X2 [Phocoena sinus]
MRVPLTPSSLFSFSVSVVSLAGFLKMRNRSLNVLDRAQNCLSQPDTVVIDSKKVNVCLKSARQLHYPARWDNRFLKHCGIQGSIMESRSHERLPWKEAWRTLVQLPTEARGLEMGRWSGRHRFSIFRSCKFKAESFFPSVGTRTVSLEHLSTELESVLRSNRVETPHPYIIWQTFKTLKVPLQQLPTRSRGRGGL